MLYGDLQLNEQRCIASIKTTTDRQEYTRLYSS